MWIISSLAVAVVAVPWVTPVVVAVVEAVLLSGRRNWPQPSLSQWVLAVQAVPA
jgi:hypothetical protein